jgi:two-component system probable response regulator PhcQ
MGHIVLLVDDDQNVIRGLTRALRRQPYQLYTAQSGDEAMWILKAHDVDVIVTDEKMPGMSGGDLIAWVAENYPEVVRIVLTGYATTETAIRAINEGAVYHFFTKPCRDVHLAIAIREALEQREKLKENLRLRTQCRHETGPPVGLQQDLQVLANVVSHDLGKPLQAMADIWHSPEKEPPAVSDHAKTLFDGVLEAAAEVQRLVTDLLEKCRDQPSTSPTSPSDSQRKCLARLP